MTDTERSTPLGRLRAEAREALSLGVLAKCCPRDISLMVEWLERIQNFTPTSEEINALPPPLRRYIHDLETRCDPAGDVAARVLAEDRVDHLLEIAFLPDSDSRPGWARRLRRGCD